MSDVTSGSGGTLADISAVLLAGGASSRMGRDKAHLEYGGETAAARTARLLSGLFQEVLIVGGDPPAAAAGRRVVDVEGPQCALRGLVSALAAASGDRVLVVATDLPFVTADLLLALVAWPEADAVVPRAGGRLHPLCAIYRRAPVLAASRPRLAAGQLALGGLLDALDTHTMEEADVRAVDPGGVALTNVNTPEELARALQDPRFRTSA
jgi:molybdopterin-guanine dinucleotide biosynthesis protein A